MAEVRVPPPPPPRVPLRGGGPRAWPVTAEVAPPPLPVYEQPELPGPGYVWTPGYWHYGAAGYFWVPGTWVMPPRVGVLWTPGYWGFAGGVYVFHAGYWGPHVGFYGGVNYGGGYVGTGYAGGRWVNGGFAYNASGHQREHDHRAQHVQRDGHQQHHRGQPRQLQRRTGGVHAVADRAGECGPA